MRLINNITLKLGLSLGLIGLLFSSFQKPQNKNLISKRVEQFACNRNLDSLVYYQNLLQEILIEEEDEKALESSGEYFLRQVMKWEQIPILQKQKILKRTPKSKAWDIAYQIQLHLSANQIDSAYSYLEKLESVSANKQALLHAYSVFVEIYLQKKANLKEAYAYLLKAENSIEKTEDSIYLYPVQAKVYAAMGYFEESIYAAQNLIKLQLQKKIVDSISVAFACYNLSEIYLQRKDYKNAKNYSGEAINFMADRVNYAHPLALMWSNFASCYYNLENKPLETILYLRKTFSLLEKVEEEVAAKPFVNACQIMALQFVKVNQLDSAQVYINKAQEIQKKHKTGLGKIWSVQGDIWNKQNKAKETEMAYINAMLSYEHIYGTKHAQTTNSRLKYGEWLLKEKKFKQAELELSKALWSTSIDNAIKNKQPVLESIFDKWQALKITNAKIETLLALYDKSQYNVSLSEIYNQAQFNIALLNQLQETHITPDNFVERAILVYEQGIEACLLLQNHHQDTSYLREAFYLAEASRELLLQESLKEPQSNTFGGVSSILIQKEKRLLERLDFFKKVSYQAIIKADSLQLDWYEEQIEKFQTELKAVQQELRNNYPKYMAFRKKGAIAKLDSVQFALKDSTALIQYLEGKNAVYQFVIRKDTFAVRKIFWRTYKPTILKYYKHFTEAKLRQHLQSGGYMDFCKTSYELYHKLMHHELLNASHHLIIIPDGLMNYVPFETLLTDIPLDSVHKINFPSLSFLLKKKNISYNYSSNIWLKELQNKKRPINSEILGIGVTYSNEQIPDFRTSREVDLRKHAGLFKGAAQEMDSLALKYAGVFYTNRYASEYYLKKYAGDYGIIHLAAHGIIDQNNPEFSSLILAEDGYTEEDNYLSINEIKQLDLNSSMVILSNFHTGYGQLQRGEGLISIGRSFMYAGCPSVVLTLWQQSDDYGSVVMDYFYENLKQKMSKDRALRLAKLRYLKNAQGIAAHPAFWAGYIQIGNTNSIEVSEPVTHIWWFIIPIACLGLLGWWSMQALRQRR